MGNHGTSLYEGIRKDSQSLGFSQLPWGKKVHRRRAPLCIGRSGEMGTSVAEHLINRSVGRTVQGEVTAVMTKKQMSLTGDRKGESLDTSQGCLCSHSITSSHVLVLIHHGHTEVLSDVDVLQSCSRLMGGHPPLANSPRPASLFPATFSLQVFCECHQSQASSVFNKVYIL